MAQAERFVFHHENVLGTSLELHMECDSPTSARQAEAEVLAEIDRLSRIFSTYDSSSELARFNRLEIGESMTASAELVQLLKRCEAWQATSRGAFNPAVDELTKRWSQAVKEGQLPSAAELSNIVRAISTQHWSTDSQANKITRVSNQLLTLNAIAKGTILDCAAEKLRDATLGATINIGGDIRIIGAIRQMVTIPHPRQDAIGGSSLAKIGLRDAAIATSGSSERQFEIAGNSYSHIFNPTTGMPCDQVLSASVIADTAETADILATICCVLPASQSVRLIESLPSARCLIYTISGAVVCSANWPSIVENAGQDKEKSTADKSTPAAAQTPHQFQLEFEIAKASDGGRYRRPYVAVWVEDKDGFPVKTLSLFLMVDNPGPRWHRDLRRWYSSDQMRVLVDPTKLIGTVSKPTRNPGVYKVAWDGTDDHGKPLSDSEYTLYIEAAREHGTYQLMKHPFSLGKKEFEEKLKGNVEIKEASFKYKIKK